MGGAGGIVLAAGGTGLALGWLLRGIFTRGSSSAKCTPQAWKQAEYVAAPHPAWTPPSKQPPPFDPQDCMSLSPATVDKASMYSFFISAIVPRPVAFISTVSATGQCNLAPYSYFGGMGHNPPMLAIGICRSGSRGGGKKDTLANIEETGEFVVNIISEWFVEASNHTCGEYDRGVDEWELSGLTPLPSAMVRPARVLESALHMECKVRHIIEINDSAGVPSQAVVLGEVVMFHVNRAVTQASPTGKVVVDPTKLRPVSRLGGVTYARTMELYEMARPAKDGSYPAAFKGRVG